MIPFIDPFNLPKVNKLTNIEKTDFCPLVGLFKFLFYKSWHEPIRV